MSALSAVQPRSAAPGRPGRPAEGGGVDDFSAVLAAAGGMAAAPAAPVAKGPGRAPHGEGSGPQGEGLHLPSSQVPAAHVESVDGAVPAVPTAEAAATATPVRPAALVPVMPAVPTAAADPVTEPVVPLPTARPPAGAAAPARVPAAAGAPAPAGVDLPLVADVQVHHEPASQPAPQPEADLPEAEAPGPAPAQSAAPAAHAGAATETSPDLPPTAVTTAPAPAAGPVTAPAASTHAAPAPPPPAAQLLTGLAPVLEGPDGTHTLSLQLYPEELGAVQVEISLRNGEISLALRTPDVGTLELLRSAAAELRTQLESTGLTSAGVSVDLGREHENPSRQGLPERGTRSGDGRPADPADEPATTLSTSDSALDVRI